MAAIDGESIVHFLETESDHPLRMAEIGRALGIRPRHRRELRAVLKRLVADGSVYRTRGGRFAAPSQIRLVVGRLRTWRGGHGVVQPEDGGVELFLPAGRLGNAMDGDLVAARIEGRGRNGREEGRVVRVLERGRRTVVGRFHAARGRSTRAGFVVPEDPALTADVVVTGSAEEVSDGDVVVVAITDWGSEHRGPVGEIETVLGHPDDPGVDVLAIIHAHELPTAFDPDAVREAEQAARRGLRASDLEGRTDCRDLLSFTIDPADAKDHDDALSVAELADGALEVGVHIADVSFYVRSGTALDREAQARGTSVYLVDRAIPMLPEALSSGLCSLVPGEDRLTLSVLFRVDTEGRIGPGRLVESVIRSRHRLSYGQAQAVFDGAASIDAGTDKALLRLRDVSRRIRRARHERGSLDLDLPETRVVLDENGVPVDVQRAERFESHRLIEDFMLLANEWVGGRAARDRLPFVFRVHEPPEADRMEGLRETAAVFGHRLPAGPTVQPKDLQRFLTGVEGRPEADLLAVLTLRSMKQARYCESDLGHFGLATRRYTHFTSPIRRYPDLLVHRILAASMLRRAAAPPEPAGLRELARQGSNRERVAVAAERDSVALKRVRFMEQHLGGEFDGTISEVRPFGLVVLLDDWFVEGLVHVSSMDDDYYEFVEERFMLSGSRSGRHFRLGQRVRIQVAAVDTEERRIDFVLPGLVPPPQRGRRPRRR